MENLEKKSTPWGAPILKQDYGTTQGSKTQWLAQILFEMIGEYDRPIKRPKNPSVDRAFRQLIAEANMNGDCIINDGSGYFRPGEEDEIVFEAYCAAERHKAWEILHRINRMEEVFERRYQ